MGGFCNVRDRCASYHHGRKQEEPSERICIYGDERPARVIRGSNHDGEEQKIIADHQKSLDIV